MGQVALVMGLAMALSAASAREANSQAKLQRNGFQLFNAMLYKGMPKVGTRLPVIYEQKLFPDQQNSVGRPPSNAGIASALRDAHEQRNGYWKADGPILVLDIERWPLWPWVGKGEHQASIALYSESAGAFRDAYRRPICLYGVVPHGGINQVTRALTDPAFRQELDASNDVAAEKIVPIVDALCPPLYTYYGAADPMLQPSQHQQYVSQWRLYAVATIAQARRIGRGKPVYAFVWPQFHSGGSFKDARFLPEDYWRIQLETLKEISDGIILWGGWDFDKNAQLPWDEGAAWWRIVKEVFLIP